MKHHQISSQYVEVPKRIANISSHVCSFHNKYDDMVCSHTMISGEKHFLEDRSCPHASTHRKHHTHNRTHQTLLCTTINPQNTRGGYAFAGRAIITPIHRYFLLGGVPFCLEYNSSNTIYYDILLKQAVLLRIQCIQYDLTPLFRHICTACEHVEIIEKPP